MLVKGAEPDMVFLQLAVKGHRCLKPVEEIPMTFGLCRCSSTPRKALAPQSPAAGLPWMESYPLECFVLSSGRAGEDLPLSARG